MAEIPSYYAYDSHKLVILVTILILLQVHIHLITRKCYNGIPQSVLTILVGIASGLLLGLIVMKSNTQLLESTIYDGPTSRYVLECYVPIFMVSTMYRMDYTSFLKYLPQVTLITFASGIVSPLLLGLILSYTMKYRGSYTCGVIRAITLVPIEPLYAVEILKRLARYKHLEALLEAESVMLMIPVYFMFHLLGGIQDGAVSEWYQVVTIILRKIIIGIIIGFVAGKIHVVLMVTLDHDRFYTVGVSICMTYIVYVLSEHVAFGSGQIALLFNICQVLSKRHKLSPQANANLVTIWSIIQDIGNTLFLSLVTMQLTIYFVYHFHISMAYGSILIYLIALVLRLMSLVLLSPLLCRMTNALNLKGVLVLGWAGLRGPLSLNFSLMLYKCKAITNTDSFLFDVFVNAAITLLLNATIMQRLFRLIRYTRIARAQKTNMNIYVDMLNMKAQHIIYNMKFNRYYAGVYWGIARNYVKLNYAGAQEDNAEVHDKNRMFERKSCEQCEMDVPYNITELEFADLLKENEMKITKLKKIFIINQYLRGNIDKQCLELISNKLARKLDFSKHRHSSINLKAYFQPKKATIFCQYIIRRLTTPPTIIPPPATRATCQLAFYTTMHVSYDFVIYIITFVNSVFILWNNGRCCDWMLKYHVGLWWFYFLDFSLKMYGLSHKVLIISACRPYFDRKCNWLDFFCLLATAVDIIVARDDNIYAWIVYYIIPSFRLIALLRLLSIGCFLRILAPILLKYIDHKINVRACRGYQLGSALIQCDEDVMAVLHEIVELKTIRDVFRKEMIGNTIALQEQLGEIQKEKPYIALTVKTKQAIQITLNALKERLQELQLFSVFELQECNYIVALLAQLQKDEKRMKLVQAYRTHEILKNVPWISSESQYQFFKSNIQIAAWNAGDLVQSKGKVSDGIYVIVTGMLRFYFVQNEVSPNGMLPIVDNLSSVDNHKTDEVLLTGDTMGELSYITGRPYDCNVVAESYSQAYWFSPDVMKKACEYQSNPVDGLVCKIWKSCCMNMTVALLMKVPVYKTRTQAEIKKKLEHCFVPNLRYYKTFILTEKIEDVLLIEGVVESALTGEVFVAPMLIPRAVQKIMLFAERDNSQSSETNMKEIVQPQLMIVPIEGVTAIDVMCEEEEMAELRPGVSRGNLITKKAGRSNPITSFTNMPSDNVDSMSMISYNWKADKEIVALDNSDSDVDLQPRLTQYDESGEMTIMPKSRPVQSSDGTALKRNLRTSKQFKDLGDDD